MPDDTQEQHPRETPPEDARPLGGDAVRAYLERHPEFFVAHPELLLRMALPARDFGSGGAAEIIDLQQYMLRASRAKTRRLEGQLTEVVGLAREGQQGMSRIHSAVLAVVGASDLRHLIEVITTDLAMIFDLDAVVLAVEAGHLPRLAAAGARLLPGGMIARLLGDDDVVLQQSIVGERQLYDSNAGLVRSQALVRLPIDADAPPALLAMGVRREREFAPSQGTDLLSFLGSVVAASLKTRLGGG